LRYIQTVSDSKNNSGKWGWRSDDAKGRGKFEWGAYMERMGHWDEYKNAQKKQSDNNNNTNERKEMIQAEIKDGNHDLNVQRVGDKIKLVLSLSVNQTVIQESRTELVSFAQGRLMISKIKARGWVNLHSWVHHDVGNWDEHCNAVAQAPMRELIPTWGEVEEDWQGCSHFDGFE
jgi:hypothetical protein